MAELHEDSRRMQVVAGVLEIVGLGDGIRERVSGIGSWQHLLHLELLGAVRGR
ncbi:MAG: hypothetical protein KJP23_12780 [Deltaproteobacteria bacterium]|nr:hypothetical protein [Deltaproteobacteria bacterium]